MLFRSYGGTFSISIATYHALLRDLCDAILRAGFKQILIINSHGGNSAALAALTTDLSRELKAPIATTSVYALPHKHGSFTSVLEDQKGVRHACEAETSMMMAAFADCVRKDKLAKAFGPKDTESPTAQSLLIWKSFRDVTPSGVMGDARRASAEKGEKLLSIAAKLLADELVAGAPWK